jgi:hypothetical protein
MLWHLCYKGHVGDCYRPVYQEFEINLPIAETI